jgi:7-cyano-7-deazaguanine synthase
MSTEENSCLVCFSGGQDSTTVLYYAKERCNQVETISFDYGQKHELEFYAMSYIINVAQVVSHSIRIPVLEHIADGGLTNEKIDISAPHPKFPHLPGSFVPLRNLIFFSQAAALAIKRNIWQLYVGVCQTDYSGYPDCRQIFLDSLSEAINLSLDVKDKLFEIKAPLMHMTKGETVELATSLDGCMEALAYSHTCYENKFPPCGKCPACVLRAKGFKDAKVMDPLVKRAIDEVVQ